jgi:hypothetical protein
MSTVSGQEAPPSNAPEDRSSSGAAVHGTSQTGQVLESGLVPPPHNAAVAALFASNYVQPALPEYSSLLTDILPVDFSGLDTTIREFLEPVERLGQTLIEGHVDLVFAAGLLAVGSVVVVGMVRRRLQPVAARASLIVERESIPYSDLT